MLNSVKNQIKRRVKLVFSLIVCKILIFTYITILPTLAKWPPLFVISSQCLFTFLFQLFGTDCGRGEVFRHCSAKFGNRLANLLAYGKMPFVRLFLALDVFTTEFVVSLGDAEQVRCKFGSTHVVQDLFVFLESLAFVDILHSQAVVKSLITAILEHGDFQERPEPACGKRRQDQETCGKAAGDNPWGRILQEGQ